MTDNKQEFNASKELNAARGRLCFRRCGGRTGAFGSAFRECCAPFIGNEYDRAEHQDYLQRIPNGYTFRFPRSKAA